MQDSKLKSLAVRVSQYVKDMLSRFLFTSRRKASDLKPGVVVVAPPWARSGSSHIFRAQVQAYEEMGCDAYVLLGPVDEWHGAYHREFWSDTMPFFQLGKNAAGYVSNFDRIQICSYSYFCW